VSPIFAEWREAQAAAGTLILFRATSGLGPPKIENNANPVEDILLEQLDTILGCNQWLRALLSSLENIPVCVSVAAASSASRGFPLIYVNKSFERATGYQRSEVLGKNCKFLQTGKHGETAEAESVAKLTTALSAKQAIKITITNFRKDGAPFRNLLAVKPIFDEKGKSLILIFFLIPSLSKLRESLQWYPVFITDDWPFYAQLPPNRRLCFRSGHAIRHRSRRCHSSKTKIVGHFLFPFARYCGQRSGIRHPDYARISFRDPVRTRSAWCGARFAENLCTELYDIEIYSNGIIFDWTYVTAT
jgi:PAS domain S-box-containing protein